MKTEFKNLCALAALMFVVGCGGGGGDDDEDDEDFFPEDADASGIWTGVLTRSGGSAVPARAIISADGDFVVTSGLIFYGSGTTSVNSLFASAVGWAPILAPFADSSTMGDFSFSGTVTNAPHLIDATFEGAGETGELVLELDSELTNTAADLELVAGVYRGANGLATVSITGNEVTLNASLIPDFPNCIGNGTISVPAGNQNIYRWELLLSGCPDDGPAEGLAFLEINTIGMYGRSPQIPTVFVGSR